MIQPVTNSTINRKWGNTEIQRLGISDIQGQKVTISYSFRNKRKVDNSKQIIQMLRVQSFRNKKIVIQSEQENQVLSVQEDFATMRHTAMKITDVVSSRFNWMERPVDSIGLYGWYG